MTTLSLSRSALSRRALLGGGAALAALTLAGCATTTPPQSRLADRRPVVSPEVLAMYAAMPDERFPIPAPRIDLVDPKFWRQVVVDPTGERPGTIVVNTGERFLYLVGENGEAMRYGVGIGRDGFSWSGRATMAYKREWPTWTPPADMIKRQPELEPYRRGMEPGIDNPLGPRALYIHQGGRDTLYRIHGNPDVSAIGHAVSSGCVRLLNQDIIDLYNRVKSGATILVV